MKTARNLIKAEKEESIKKEIKLKPCPFCGLTRSLIVGTDKEIEELDREGTGYYAVCCNAKIGGCGSASGYKKSKEEAIKLWNTRFKEEIC